ncbi:MAG: glycosyltransferase family 25 protein [Rhodomicrobium sp.]
MKLYVINLDRDHERMARIGALLQEIGAPFERVPAVDGRTLPAPPAEAPDNAYVLSRGEIALIRSHQNCWDLFEQSGEPYCAILEDDVHFGSDFAAFVSAPPEFPADLDLIKIEATQFKIWLNKYDSHPITNGRKLVRLASPHMGTAGYVLSRRGLGKVRDLTKRYQQFPIDVVVFGFPGKHLIKYQLLPSLVIQDAALKQANSPDYAGITGTINRGRKPKPRGLQKVLREIARPFRSYWPPGPLAQKWRLSYGKVEFE